MSRNVHELDPHSQVDAQTPAPTTSADDRGHCGGSAMNKATRIAVGVTLAGLVTAVFSGAIATVASVTV